MTASFLSYVHSSHESLERQEGERETVVAAVVVVGLSINAIRRNPIVS